MRLAAASPANASKPILNEPNISLSESGFSANVTDLCTIAARTELSAAAVTTTVRRIGAAGWDTRDEGGALVGAGVYYVRLADAPGAVPVAVVR